MPIRHAYQTASPDDPGSEVSATEWNADHAVDTVELPTQPSNPTPPADGVTLYAAARAGRRLPMFIGPAGVDSALQPSFFGNSIFVLAPSSGTTAPTVFGGTPSTATTMSLPALSSAGGLWPSVSRKRFQTSTTANTTTGVRTAYTQWWRGNAAGLGGFFFRARFGIQINLNTSQLFVGLCASTAALAGDPSALVNMIGMGFDTADASTGNWFLMHNDASGVATRVDLGADAARNTTNAFELTMFGRPNGDRITVEVQNIQTGVQVLAPTELTTNIPESTAFMAMKAEVRNVAAAAANIEVARIYIESDY